MFQQRAHAARTPRHELVVSADTAAPDSWRGGDADGAPPPAKAARVGSAYRPLFKYLDKRFADEVVLTFGEIEDLLGSKLPEAATQRADWWMAPAPGDPASGQAGAWLEARRTAVPNLLAQRVSFARI